MSSQAGQKRQVPRRADAGASCLYKSVASGIGIFDSLPYEESLRTSYPHDPPPGIARDAFPDLFLVFCRESWDALLRAMKRVYSKAENMSRSCSIPNDIPIPGTKGSGYCLTQKQREKPGPEKEECT